MIVVWVWVCIYMYILYFGKSIKTSIQLPRWFPCYSWFSVCYMVYMFNLSLLLSGFKIYQLPTNIIIIFLNDTNGCIKSHRQHLQVSLHRGTCGGDLKRFPPTLVGCNVIIYRGAIKHTGYSWHIS